MISRVWHGWTRASDADAYEQLLQTRIFPDIEARRIAGYRGAFLYRRDNGDEVEFTTTLFFDGVDGVRAFAGEDQDKPVIHPIAERLLTRSDARSAHYAVVRVPADRIPG